MDSVDPGSRVLIDAGPIVAIRSESDQHHAACVEQLAHIKGPLLTCWPVITEAAWLLRAYPSAVAQLVLALNGRPFHLVPLSDTDLHGVAAILTRYKSLNIQLADASLLHLANRERIDTVFTLDRRDFGVVRLAHGKRLRLIP